MKTKTLILTAALSVAGAATTFAQVYSVNAVGYVNLSLVKGFQMICNPLIATDNTVAGLLGTQVPNGTIVYKYDLSGATPTYKINSLVLGSWTDTAMTMNVGEGAFVKIPAAAGATVTFVGNVATGSLTTHLPKGFAIVSSQVPQAGVLDTDLGYPVANGDIIYQFNPTTQKYVISSYVLGSWSTSTGNGPSIGVGESFWSKKLAATTWARTFSVNQ